MTPRATPLAPEDRRTAILAAADPAPGRAGRRRHDQGDRPGGGHRRGHDLPGLPRQGRRCCSRRPRRRSTPPGARRRSPPRWPSADRPARARGHRRRAGPRPDAADDGGDGRRPPLPRRQVSTRPHQKKKKIPLGPPRSCSRRSGPARPADRTVRAVRRRARRRPRDGRARPAQPDLRRRPPRARHGAGADRPTRSRTSCSTASAPHDLDPSGELTVDPPGAHVPGAVQAAARVRRAAAVRRHARRALPAQAERRHHRQGRRHRRHRLHHPHRRA